MTEKRKSFRNGGSVLSLRQTVPSGWREERPALAGDPVFDWESQPEPPRPDRIIRFGVLKPKRQST
ncbi:hypothetical protein J2Z79_000141 [Symbiobacterium terraclitae]|uniref:Uncharacterized protein n=1 Tax=Symbiobacterium terraclitae TaxID=557451 RepID=A0ABS4JMJ9_9FIRM|nr:hypothetical protein [Symbiobacterium terraclitae]